MKKTTVFILVLGLCFLVSGFDWDVRYFEYEPVFMDRRKMEQNIRTENPRPVVNPGKIYVKDQYVLIVEKYRGIHVIDNSDPEAPVNALFVCIDGCMDVAMKDHVLFADNAVDLIALSVAPSWNGAEVSQRIRNVFPEIASPDGRELTLEEKMAQPDNSVLVRWRKK